MRFVAAVVLLCLASAPAQAEFLDKGERVQITPECGRWEDFQKKFDLLKLRLVWSGVDAQTHSELTVVHLWRNDRDGWAITALGGADICVLGMGELGAPAGIPASRWEP